MMATPKWTYNKLIKNINEIETVMVGLDPESTEFKKLNSVAVSLTELAVLMKQQHDGNASS